ncbi:hypothetical protein HETIRDRAFT_425641 [Heterobasidion irregulare TC 32-1]|uniref:Uncharacterized protein n=1 Tax=Heterobasidion irregulare (strain TC 32-1) TaxID=747525 RepID=W4KGI3_HETIT|nr:uncharacterized protein HETIRDRAFT_425641 [Heterobasidion irregulare TC 32-1]ETW84176.1 hypothetical protein HETIRDRAFT_425641 [Heterobasidion irregulare TC 32-1]
MRVAEGSRGRLKKDPDCILYSWAEEVPLQELLAGSLAFSGALLDGASLAFKTKETTAQFIISWPGFQAKEYPIPNAKRITRAQLAHEFARCFSRYVETTITTPESRPPLGETFLVSFINVTDNGWQADLTEDIEVLRHGI